MLPRRDSTYLNCCSLKVCLPLSLIKFPGPLL